MFENHDAVRRNGRWDPSLDAYRVDDPKNGTKYYVWKKPAMLFEAAASTVVVLFWVGVAAFVFLFFFHWPEGVAGDRRAQLAEVLYDRYRVEATYLPANWNGSQVFTLDIEQGWDDPNYDEPSVETKGCRLQPGETADDLSLQCPTPFGSYSEIDEGGLDADNDRRAKSLLEKPPATPPAQSPGSDDSRDQYEPDPDEFDVPDPYENYEPDPYDYYEPEEMYP